MSAAPKKALLVTLSGRDAPGITAEITGLLAQLNSPVLDIGQAVIHQLLSLFILIQFPDSGDEKPLLKDLLFKATELGMKLEFQILDLPDTLATSAQVHADRYAITLIADRISAQALHQVTTTLARHGLNIDIIEKLSEADFSCVEMLASSTRSLDRPLLKKQLLEIATQQTVDIALQAEGLFRRTKRLVVLDMDSTLIQNEVIDEFAREFGVYQEVAKITEEAMRGKMNYDQSLSLRCQKLKGLTTRQIDAVIGRIQLTPGAEDLIRVLKRLGYKTGLISGGFQCVAEPLRQKLGIDYAYANQLELKDGVATGNVIPPIINAQRKADLLDVIAQQERIQLDQVIAIGDGANDILMLEKAGLGIAFNAKPLVREKADLSLNQHNLRSVLYLLGLSGRDFAELLT